MARAWITWLGSPPLWRTALAAALAWQLASWSVGERPYFAPLAAVLCTQVTVAASVARALERTAGVAGGIVLALAAVRLLGASAVSVGALVLVGMAVSQRLGVGPAAVSQVAVSAILVLSLGAHTPGYALARVVDTVIGAATAVVLQLFVFPTDFTTPAERAVRALACRVAALWRAAARAAGDRHRHAYACLWQRARAADEDLRHAAAALRLAQESLRLTPLGRGRRERVRRLSVVLGALDQSLRHSRGALRLLAEHPSPAPPRLLRSYCRAVAHIALALGQEALPMRTGAIERARWRLTAAAATLATCARPRPEAAALAVESDEWLRDLGGAAEALAPYRPPPLGRRRRRP